VSDQNGAEANGRDAAKASGVAVENEIGAKVDRDDLGEATADGRDVAEVESFAPES